MLEVLYSGRMWSLFWLKQQQLWVTWHMCQQDVTSVLWFGLCYPEIVSKRSIQGPHPILNQLMIQTRKDLSLKKFLNPLLLLSAERIAARIRAEKSLCAKPVQSYAWSQGLTWDPPWGLSWAVISRASASTDWFLDPWTEKEAVSCTVELCSSEDEQFLHLPVGQHGQLIPCDNISPPWLFFNSSWLLGIWTTMSQNSMCHLRNMI